ncbi:MAG: OmpH family outer membrane protein, partial [Bacteroidia bacterium]|nr:OmpH family outer membrane protein [Bacteroidia bacterium]
AGADNLKAQNKVGVFDVNYALPQLPDYKRAQSELEIYQKKLQEGLQAKQLDLQKLYDQVQGLGPDAPQAQRQELGNKLQVGQEELQKAQQDAQTQFGKKQTELLEPLYKTLQDKINEVAKENGFSYVLRLEASLFEPENSNISDMVLKKMGVTPIANQGEGRNNSGSASSDNK